MAAWASGAWASGVWAGTAWDESAAPSGGASWFETAWAPGAWGSGAWNVGGGSSGESFTSSAVFFIPFRAVSGLWANSGVGQSVPPGNQAWLPSIRQPIAYVDSRDGKVYCDPIWYRAFEFVFETRLGGRLGPSIPDVVTTVTATQATAAAASATVAEVAQQTQANAEALFVVREVVQGGALDGADQIPGVDLR